MPALNAVPPKPPGSAASRSAWAQSIIARSCAEASFARRATSMRYPVSPVMKRKNAALTPMKIQVNCLLMGLFPLLEV